MQDKCCKNQKGGTDFHEAVCIHTDKIYDSCRDKDCLEDARVYLTRCGQEVLDRAISIKFTKAEVIWVYSDIEAVPFNRGYYSVDLKYFFKITLQVFCGTSNPTTVEGLATFDKRVILFGSEGNVKSFSSKYKEESFDPQMLKKNNMPFSVIEVVEPIALGAKLVNVMEDKCCKRNADFDISSVPECICRAFDDSLILNGEINRAYVSLGVFSIVKLERRSQLLIPCYDYCVPNKECVGASEESPCDLFEGIDFPMDEFYPPGKCAFKVESENRLTMQKSGCSCRQK